MKIGVTLASWLSLNTMLIDRLALPLSMQRLGTGALA